MVAVYIKKILHYMSGLMFKGDNYMFFVSPVSGLVEKFNIVIYSGTKNVINVELCMTVLLTELCLFIPLSVTLTVLTENSVFSS